MSLIAQAKQEMQRSWNARATRNPFFYVETTHWDGNVDRFFQLGEKSTQRLIDPVLSGFAIAKNTALDLGCGLGRFSRALAQRFNTVIAVDVSKRMVAQAEELNNKPRHGNISFRVNDGVTIPVPDKAVDFVWSYEVFQHLPTHEIIQANFNEIGRVLRPGGLAMIHLKTGYQRPAVHAVLRNLPPRAITLAIRLAGRDPLMADRTFQGAPPLKNVQAHAIVDAARLKLLEIASDPTHAPGTRAFALIGKSAL